VIPYLICGLGNPGSEYARTRHNAGFLVTSRLGERWSVRWNYEKKFNAQLARAERDGRTLWLCQPQTYMNSSGEAVRAVTQFYQVPITNLVVVVDDADLPFGELRLRPGGSSGGHHGLESIEQHLGTRDYARLRIGIGRQDGARQITGYVLGRFSSTEAERVDNILNAASDQLECWLESGIQKAMSQFNGIVNDPNNERKEQ
jgi:peptidyl-tRNA hydrolase, PTH1 family